MFLNNFDGLDYVNQLLGKSEFWLPRVRYKLHLRSQELRVVRGSQHLSIEVEAAKNLISERLEK